MSFRLHGAQKQIPVHRQRALADTADIKEGALLLVDGSGLYDECGTNPALIAAIAKSDAGVGSGPEYPIGSKEFPPGYMQGLVVSAEMDLTALYTGTLGTVGTAYGVTKGSDGVWRVDFAKTGGDARVEYIKNLDVGPIDHQRIVVRILAANVQPA